MSSMYESLTRWVELQKKAKEWFDSIYEAVKSGDRLDLILYIRMAFQHMIKTLKAFDSWLQDPLIISNMPRDELEYVWEKVYKILEQLIELDIKHTSGFRDHIVRLEKEGKLNPLLMELLGGERRRRGGEKEGVTLSI